MKLSLLSLILLLVGSILAFWFYQTSRGEFRCKEEPFSSLATPIKEIDTSVFVEGDDVINGGKAVVVRLRDANDREVYLVAVKRPNANFDLIITDSPIEWGWDDRVGVIPDATGPAKYIRIPEDLYDPPENYRMIDDVKAGLRDLIYILNKYRDPSAPDNREIDIALDAFN